jgi:hypothetical protein
MATLIQTLQNILASKDPLLALETKRIMFKGNPASLRVGLSL